jgi:hypothetical protein
MKRFVVFAGAGTVAAVACLFVVTSCSPNSNGIAKSFDLAGTDIIDPNAPDLYGENIFPDFGDTDGGATHDPTTCAEAEMSKSYIGCDYWPTVTGTAVWSVFDYAVVVSNPGMSMANVTVSGGALSAPVMQQIAPGTLVKIGLPWIPALKGPDASPEGASGPMTNSVKAMKAAYHLVADVPVLVYQFNALEYQAGASGNDLQGLAWSTCPATMNMSGPCLSYSNDASLLLPSTAMTPNYVVTGIPGDDMKPSKNGTPMPFGSSYIAITATADNTTITLQLSKTGDILASSDNTTIAAVAQNMSTPAKVMYTLNAGDVIELVGGQGSGHDFTGSIIEASQPIQVIAGIPCTTNPTDYITGGFLGGPAYSCDHIEETLLPIETWGKAYGVTAPTGPNGTAQMHSVRIYGGTAASTLTFVPAITGAPAMVAAGGVATFTTSTDFVVSGDKEFAVSSEQMSAEVITQLAADMNNPKGDPSFSFFSAMAQYRDKYLILAPSDYDVNYVDIVIPDGTNLMLDGAAVSQMPKTIGGGFSSVRVPLSPGASNGAHTLTGDQPFGIQVVGYGAQTSYQYPGGLDLKVIAPPPPIL